MRKIHGFGILYTMNGRNICHNRPSNEYKYSPEGRIAHKKLHGIYAVQSVSI